MAETNTTPLTPEDVQNLKNEMVLLALNPDAIQNYATENDRTIHIDQLKTQLTEHGIDADQVLADAVTERFNLKAPIGDIVEFRKKAS